MALGMSLRPDLGDPNRVILGVKQAEREFLSSAPKLCRFAELFWNVAVGAVSGYRNGPGVATAVPRNAIQRRHLQLDATECRSGTAQFIYENDGLHDCETYDRNSRSACSTS